MAFRCKYVRKELEKPCLLMTAIHRRFDFPVFEDPIATFKRNIYLSPFYEDKLAALIDLMGADHILFGSDYPHPEGLADPCSYIQHLPAGMSADDIRKIMGGNLSKLMGVAPSSPASA